MRRLVIGAIATSLLTTSGACTHQRIVRTQYSSQVMANVRPGSICPRGEVVGVDSSNRTADPDSAGTTEAGIHTFNYRFDADPALALKRGLQEALQAGGCHLDGSAAAANLFLRIQRIEARGDKCGMWSCPGSGAAMVAVTLTDGAGHPLLKQDISSAANMSCGMVMCNEEEASALASDVLTSTITKTVGKFAGAIAKQLARPPVAPATTPQAEPPAVIPAPPSS
jgi:hypothetical protein